MSQIALPYTFTANTLIQSAQVNSNFTTITGVVNGQLDSTNVNASVGIGANYIVSSGNGATGAFQGGAYTFTAGAVGSVPLTVTGITNQTADLFDVTLTSGGTKAFKIASTGAATFSAGVTLGGALAGATTGAFSGAVSTGALTVTGGVTATTSIAAGSATGATLTAGDLGASRSTNTGALTLGGSGGSATFDYNISKTNQVHLNSNLDLAGALSVALNASIAGGVAGNSVLASVAPATLGLTAGDLGASRSTTTGALTLGGSSSAGTLDYGVTTAGKFTFNQDVKTTGSWLASSSTYGPTSATVAGSAFASGKVVAGLTTDPGVGTSGDVVATRSATQGVIFFGQSNTAASVDWNIRTASVMSLSTAALTGYPAVNGGAYTNASDRRWKKNIKTVRYGLSEVARLRPVRYEWKQDGRVDLGFIAQEIEPIIPELVKTDGKGYKMLNYDGLIPVLVAAIQELSERVDELE